jgi:NADH-quinone oxidoreductase subunit N
VNYQILLLQLLPEAVLVLTALVLLGVGVAVEARKGRPVDPKLTIGIATAGIALAFVALVREPMEAGSGSALVAVDGLARLAKGLLLVFGVLAFWLPPAKREISHPGEFHALMLFALTGLMLAVGTSHLLFLFVSLELASLSLYLLVGFPRTARAAEASMKYFLFGGVSAAFMLFGLSLLYGFSQSAILSVIGAKIGADPGSLLALTGLVMLLAGMAFKLAAAPFHYWAPDVYQGAPATSVALVSAASKVVGLFVLVRVLVTGFHASAGSAAWGAMEAGWSLWLAALAAVSMVFGNLLALAQTSVRRLLAYSAVANTGYLLVGLSSNGHQAMGASLFYVVVYGVATLGALAVTAAVERGMGNDDRSSFAGLIHRSPLQGVCMLVFLASLAGVPPLAGFVGKFAVFVGAMKDSVRGDEPGLAWLVALAVAMSAVSLYYYLRILKQAFAVPASLQPAGRDDLPLEHRLAILLPAAALVVLGCCPSLLMEPVIKVVETVLGAP